MLLREPLGNLNRDGRDKMSTESISEESWRMVVHHKCMASAREI